VLPPTLATREGDLQRSVLEFTTAISLKQAAKLNGILPAGASVQLLRSHMDRRVRALYYQMQGELAAAIDCNQQLGGFGLQLYHDRILILPTEQQRAGMRDAAARKEWRSAPSYPIHLHLPVGDFYRTDRADFTNIDGSTIAKFMAEVLGLASSTPAAVQMPVVATPTSPNFSSRCHPAVVAVSCQLQNWRQRRATMQLERACTYRLLGSQPAPRKFMLLLLGMSLPR
jgi:hypothetical protein